MDLEAGRAESTKQRRNHGSKGWLLALLLPITGLATGVKRQEMAYVAGKIKGGTSMTEAMQDTFVEFV